MPDLLAATGFTNNNLSVLIAGLLGSDYRYQLTPSHPHRRLLHQDVPDARPAHRCQPTPSTTPLRAALATITRHVDTYATHAQIPEPPDNLTQM